MTTYFHLCSAGCISKLLEMLAGTWTWTVGPHQPRHSITCSQEQTKNIEVYYIKTPKTVGIDVD